MNDLFESLNKQYGILPDIIEKESKKKISQMRDMFNRKKDELLETATEEQKAAISLIDFGKKSIEESAKSLGQLMNTVRDSANKVAEDFEGLMKDLKDIEYKKKFQTLYDVAWNEELFKSDYISGYVPQIPKIKISAFPTDPNELVGFLHQTTVLEGNPWDEYKPVDSAIMWEEKDYNGQPEYEYNKVYTSEAGHQTIIDDTPGNERLQWTHGQTGTYEEWNASGDRNCKITGTSRDTVEGHRLIKTAADFKSSTMGNEQSYVLGNRVVAVDGNDSLTVTGNGTVYVNGNVNVIIIGDASVHVHGETLAILEKDATIMCNDNADISVAHKATVNAENIDVTAKQTMNLNATDININASNNAIVSGGALAQLTGGNTIVG